MSKKISSISTKPSLVKEVENEQEGAESQELLENQPELDEGQVDPNLEPHEENHNSELGGSEEVLTGIVRARATKFRLYDPYQKIYFITQEFTEAPRYSNWMRAQANAGLLEVEQVKD